MDGVLVQFKTEFTARVQVTFMLTSELKKNRFGNINKSQRVSYSCDECGKIQETYYYCYLRREEPRIDLCTSCKQSGSRAPNYGKVGEKNYFYRRKHSDKTKKEISKTKIGDTYDVIVPNDEFPHLIGTLIYSSKTEKPLSVQDNVNRKCDSCGNIQESFNFFKYCKNGGNANCKSCLAKEYLQSALKEWTSDPENWKTLVNARAAGMRKFDVRKKLSAIHQGIDVNDWTGFSPKHKDIETKNKLKEWRLSIFKRDNYTCMFPNCSFCHNKYGGVSLAAHHIMPKSKYPNLMFDIRNGVTVCDKVHKCVLNKHEEEYVLLLNEVIK